MKPNQSNVHFFCIRKQCFLSFLCELFSLPAFFNIYLKFQWKKNWMNLRSFLPVFICGMSICYTQHSDSFTMQMQNFFPVNGIPMNNGCLDSYTILSSYVLCFCSIIKRLYLFFLVCLNIYTQSRQMLLKFARINIIKCTDFVGD